MHTAADFADEKSELQSVLASGIFNRAPNLAHVLTYVCGQYFEGAAEQIKEYNIAVEALGRPPGFDQKRDSIVRVEVHRLRKRLREYYEADGAGHSVRIDIPSGQYAPQFVRQRPPQPSLAEQALVALAAPKIDGLVDRPAGTAADQIEVRAVTPLLNPISFGPSQPLLLAPPAKGLAGTWIAIFLAVIALSGVFLWKAPAAKPGKTAPSPVAGTVPGPSQEMRILAGQQSGDYTDRFGRVWQSDRYFQGGAIFESTGHPIAAARDPRLFRSRREGAFTYDIPLPPGVYEMRLYFAETLYGENNIAGGGETSRIFEVFANGAGILNDFDVIGEAGANTADIRAFKDISPAADGKLHLKFEPKTNPAIVSAIEITAGTPGKLRPIRIVSREHPYTDKQGRTWAADGYSRGGQLVMRTEPVLNIDDPELLHGERYGNLTYVIPAPAGRYGVTLYFAEAWFGPRNFAGGGVGSRIFDILCNGVAIRRGFDIFKEAHGSDRAVILPIHGVEPDAQGKLNISLVPVRNYASLNALEVVDESK
ncbi:MAG: malectin domain-containing carbohydrate-binding protein [Bryobacteraceae bacterium]